MIFDDYLNLDQLDLDRYQLMVFQGDSGSGKSTALQYLAQRYSDERSLESVHTGPSDFDTPQPIPQNALVIYDEIFQPRQLKHITTLLAQSNTIAIASHLNPAWFIPLRLRYTTNFWWTDRDQGKIGRYLRQKNIEFSQSAVQHYCRQFRATYTDIDIILERHPTAHTFDEALHYFNKTCTMRRGRWPCDGRWVE